MPTKSSKLKTQNSKFWKNLYNKFSKKTTNTFNFKLLTFNFWRSQMGFTLVEILVVIAIIGIIGAYIFVNFQSSKEEQKVQKELLQIQSTLKLAQSNASASVVCDDLGGGALWQVELNPSSETVKIGCLKEGEDLRPKKTYALETGVNMTFFCPGTGSSFSSIVTITYAPFSGLPAFAGGDTCGVAGLGVRFQSEKDSAIFKQFTISSGGAVQAK
ncbi:prepilin-type N-terminal cleavage/methylation domain-containing protein [Candidatus Daviesbacteria bacterium]|nr:prepilin-type N-terminal cleavage/methylation domain-containing protein [Candidatus Daviesbacteria bacterium]